MSRASADAHPPARRHTMHAHAVNALALSSSRAALDGAARPRGRAVAPSTRARGRAARCPTIASASASSAHRDAATSDRSATTTLSVADLARPALPSHGANEIATVAGRAAAAPPPPPAPAFPHNVPTPALVAAGALALALGAKAILDKPSRAYVQGPGGDSIGTVGEEYDAWTEEGILEHYWGEHIHLGYYTDEDMAKGAGTLLGCRVKDFVEAKFDFVDKMLEWSGCPPNPAMVLDVGCGIGGTSRHLAKALGPKSKVQGITLSPNQVQRATELAATQGVDNASFRVMNALEMEFPDDTFDLVWACESGEHMPDKKKYVEEMIRVLKPGGTIVIATWCQVRSIHWSPYDPVRVVNADP